MDQEDQKKKISPLARFLMEPIALFVWFYFLVKTFIYDFDYYLVTTYAPALQPVLDNRLFVILGCISLFMLVLKKDFLPFFLYVIGYPLVVFVWKIPKLFIKNWELTIAFVPAFYDVLSEFKKHFIAFSLFVISVSVIFKTGSPYTLLPAMAILSVLLLIHLKVSFLKAYRSNVFDKIAKKISGYKDKLSDPSYLGGVLTNTANKDKAKEIQNEPSLTNLYLFHSVAAFIGEKIRTVAKSRKIDLYLFCSWLLTVLSTWFIFSLQYFSISKLYPNSFSISGNSVQTLSYMSCLGLSFDKLFPYNNSTVSPVTELALIACYAQTACAIVLGFILIFTLLTAARERYKEDLDLISQEINGIGDALQNGFQSIFKITLSDAEASLLIDNKGLVNFSRKMRGLSELSVSPEDQPKPVIIENIPQNENADK
jgi:hypothetical protein